MGLRTNSLSVSPNKIRDGDIYRQNTHLAIDLL
jgi:hypothetical protein